MNSNLYWWCSKCKINVDILHAYSIGIFCIQCGHKVTNPKNIKIPKFLDEDDYNPDIEEVDEELEINKVIKRSKNES